MFYKLQQSKLLTHWCDFFGDILGLQTTREQNDMVFFPVGFF